jgi:hypothetical protein
MVDGRQSCLIDIIGLGDAMRVVLKKLAKRGPIDTDRLIKS